LISNGWRKNTREHVSFLVLTRTVRSETDFKILDYSIYSFCSIFILLRILFLSPNYMEQSTSWKADSYSAT
jgi:hypothetical protein